jgi:hypothetical protein
MSSTLDFLLSRPDLVWKPGERRVFPSSGLPTGYGELDAVLRDRGWPRGGLIELLAGRPGAGELRLILPVLERLGRSGMYQLWLDPPLIPFGPALAAQGIDLAQVVIVRPRDRLQWLWAAEQALRSPGCGAVVCWTSASRARYPELRKLQVAAAERQCVGFLFGSLRDITTASPAALRLGLTPSAEGLQLKILKQRGAAAGQRVALEIPHDLRKVSRIRQRAAVVSAARVQQRELRRNAWPQPIGTQLETRQ